jgi:RNA recognition motif-containing protein
MNIYVSNLSYRLKDEDLKSVFEEYGEVTSAKIIMDNMTGRSKGFGFVEMPDNDAATKAIKELNEATYDGKVITVNEARPREDRPKGNFGGGGGNRGGGFKSGGHSGGYNSDRKPKRW